MATAAFIEFGGHCENFVCWLAGEFTGNNREAEFILNAIKTHVSKADYWAIKRILEDSCPASVIMMSLRKIA